MQKRFNINVILNRVCIAHCKPSKLSRRLVSRWFMSCVRINSMLYVAPYCEHWNLSSLTIIFVRSTNISNGRQED
jgi:hypothetical protein